MDSGKILGAMSQVLAEQENETRKQIEELELTIKMQKGIIKDLEKRIGEEKRLCADWRKRALIAEKGGAMLVSTPALGSDQTAADPITDKAARLQRIWASDAGVLFRAVHHFGPQAQKLKTVEELLELSLALVRDRLGRSDPANIAEEHADVEIMLQQLSMIQQDKEDVETWTREKLNRLSDILERDEI